VRTTSPLEATGPSASWRFAARLTAGVLLLTGLAFIQDPGLLAADTKFDLVLDPADFLRRAAHLWDARGALGQVQNQAYGYLWPMGPFFLLGAMLDVPGWVVQRLWMSVVLGVSFVGAARLSRALGVRSDLACLAAGLAFALSPRMLTTVGPVSIEAWPSAVAPYVLLALVRGSRQGSPVRAAALAGLGVGMVGGVNAAATLAVIPLGVVWVLTRSAGRRRRALMIWWPVFTLVATAWWLLPLFLLGSYSPPFLDFIESASITTFPTTLFDSVRGTSAWVPYVDSSWRAGNDLITTYFLPLNSGVVLALGVAGLANRRNPERVFLTLALTAGLVLVTFGHAGAVQGWSAATLQSWLDGALAPLRNVHKFDPVIRLPMVVGLAWSVETLVTGIKARASRTGDAGLGGFLERANRVGIGVLVVLALGFSALPVGLGRLTPANATLEVPEYWSEAAAWLAEQPGAGASLLVPGSGFAEYTWGTTGDEPLQSLARSRWTVRNAIPLTPPGNIRMLDEIEKRFFQGEGSPGLGDYLRRAGIGYLVVRNDLARSGDVADPVVVHQALSDTPGVRRVAAFGPDVGGEGHLFENGERVVINGGWQASYPAVEIYQVPGSGAAAAQAATLPVVVGGPEDLLDLADLGILTAAPTRLAVDLGPGERPSAPVVLTDGLQVRERMFGRMHDSYSAMLMPGDRRRSGNPTRDYLMPGADRWSTTTRLAGVARLSASSSMSDSTTIGGARPDQLPFAAMDGNEDTSWVSGTGSSSPPWWRVDLVRPRTSGTIWITGGASATEDQSLRVRTESGVTPAVAVGPGETRAVDLPEGTNTWIQLEGVGGPRLAVAEVAIPGVGASRRLILPDLPTDWPAPAAIVLRTLSDARSGCVVISDDVRCVEGQDRGHEETGGLSREFALPHAARYTPSLVARPIAGKALVRRLQRGELVRATATSLAVADLRSGPLSAIDGDPGTTWTARRGDLRPALTLRWVGRRRVADIAIGVSPDAAARRPTRVTLVGASGRRSVSLDERGRATFNPMRTDWLSIRIDEAEPVSSLGFDNVSTRLGAGIGEVRVSGLPFLPHTLSTTSRRFGCGTGPMVTVDGQSWRTSVTAVPDAILSGEALTAELCGSSPVLLDGSRHQVDVVDSRFFAADSLVLRSGTPVVGAAPAPVVMTVTDAANRLLAVPEDGGSSGAVVVLHENANRGWAATSPTGPAPPVTVDGWQQGFVSDGSALRLRFSPDRGYRGSLFGGLMCLAALAMVVGLVGQRRWPGADAPRLAPRHVGGAALILVALGAAGLVAGWPGVAVTGAAVLGATWAHHRHPDGVEWVLSLGVLGAAVAYAFAPWADPGGWGGQFRWPHYLVLASLMSVLAISGGSDRSIRDRRRRWIGPSIKR
jgi:arabinofuranan 3-O-arabinosyltransferase